MSESIDRNFDLVAQGYSRFRPNCPARLIEIVVEHCAATRWAWEPGCGSGQVTPCLAACFDEVLATDPAEHAIARCPSLERVRFEVGSAEQCALPDGSVDLVVSGQAAHWFDMETFAAEVRRVAAPGGIVAVWCYDLPRVNTAIDVVVDRLYFDVLAGCWAGGRNHIDTRYANLHFPFEERSVDVPPYEAQWAVEGMLGYLRTWSAGVAYTQAGRGDAVGEVEKDLRSSWGDRVRAVHWPVAIRLGVVA